MALITAIGSTDEEVTLDPKMITHVVRDAGNGGSIVSVLGGNTLYIRTPYADFVKAWANVVS